ncbi:MAG: Phosphoribosylglycinamide formyltransferase [Anaerolineae bacterium]|nr:Phosphoribosylglycinamide formyltransferase [Anaerolineae bacterium]
MTKSKLVVLISGSGSNLQALLDACEAGTLPAKILLVVSNKASAYGLRRAESRRIPTAIFKRRKNVDRRDYDEELGRFIAALEPDWVILAGWMHLLSMNFLRYFPGRVVNLHPALPGQFPGTHAIERAFEAFRQGDIEQTGIMVHVVPDEGVDDGPVLATEIVPIEPDDTLEALEQRIHATEHRLLVETVRRLISGELHPG